MLVGRATEQDRLAGLLESARGGTSATLILVGEPGIGKTALLDHTAATANGFEIVRARGIESEAELAYAALFELCRPLLDRLERLEPPQAEALRAAFGLGGEQPPTPFGVGAATLSLLAAAAEDRPLLLLVDDAHWLDRSSADALAFAVRRLRADSVVALFAARPGEGRSLSHHELPELELGGLDAQAAAALLARTIDGAPADPPQEILEAAAGNPLALLELPRELAAGDGGAEPLRLGKRLERAFAARAATLPDDTRRALVVAAATTTTEISVLRDALERLGVPLAALHGAESSGLLSLGGGTFEFRHPLVRSALYHAAEPTQRRSAHGALAAALGADDRAAWHRAAAAVGPDDEAAAGLERAAEHATSRSGFAAAAAAYERAARLSQQRDDRLRRLTAAADAAWLAGRTPHALALIEEALAHTDDRRTRGDLLHTRGTIEHFVGDFVRAHATLEEAAALLEGADRGKACLSLIEAVGSALSAGEIKRAVALSERASAIAARDQPDQRLLAAFSHGAVLLMDGRPEEGLTFLQQAAGAFQSGGLLADDPRHLSWAALAAFWVGDTELMVAKAAEAVEWAREHTAVATLPFAARLLARGQLLTGHWQAARASLAEALETSRISRQETQEADTLGTLAWLDAAQGRADECRRNVERGLEIAERSNFRWRNGLLHALVLLELGLGVDEASPGVARFREAHAERPMRDTPANATVPDLVEALVRIGDVEAARELLEPFADEAERLGQAFPRAVALRCRALLVGDGVSDELFERALELHALDRNVFSSARTQLAYGERLRRTGRRIDARRHLREALTVFERLEADPWAERARGELRATGERLKRRDPTAREELTPQELQIAAVVAEGKTNREVGAQLFLSPKTVEWHLGHIYRKVGVRSRAELVRALDATGFVKS